MASENETVADIVKEMRDIFALTGIDKNKSHLMGFFERIETAHQREVAKLEHWINSAARWIKCHDIYHTSGDDLIKQAKEILNDDGEFLFKKGEQ